MSETRRTLLQAGLSIAGSNRGTPNSPERRWSAATGNTYRPPKEVPGRAVRLLASSVVAITAIQDGWCNFGVRSILDNDVAVIG